MVEERVKDGNFYVVQSFMVKELKLKGLERDVYAIIYGFSQTKNQHFTGSLQYLADWTCSTKRGVLKTLNKLVEKGFIYKYEYLKNGVKFVEYWVTEFRGGELSSTGGSELSSIGGGELSSPNNIENNNINNNIDKKENIEKKKFAPPTLEEVQDYVRERNSVVDAKHFYDYFSVGNWKDSKGNPVKNWKQKLITWEKFAKDEEKHESFEDILRRI